MEIIGYGKNVDDVNATTNSLDCGQDSFFINKKNNIFCVCDGVGGWSHHNIDSGIIARKICSNGKAISNKELNPKNIMIKAYEKIIENKEVDAGGTTCCIIHIENYKLISANIGDSGYVIIRNNKIFYISFSLDKNLWNPPESLDIIPKHLSNIIGASSLDEITTNEIILKKDDIIILATDGLWDNVDIDDLNSINLKDNVKQIVMNLMELVEYNSYKPDDTTIIVCKIL